MSTHRQQINYVILCWNLGNKRISQMIRGFQLIDMATYHCRTLNGWLTVQMRFSNKWLIDMATDYGVFHQNCVADLAESKFGPVVLHVYSDGLNRFWFVHFLGELIPWGSWQTFWQLNKCTLDQGAQIFKIGPIFKGKSYGISVIQ